MTDKYLFASRISYMDLEWLNRGICIISCVCLLTVFRVLSQSSPKKNLHMHHLVLIISCCEFGKTVVQLIGGEFPTGSTGCNVQGALLTFLPLITVWLSCSLYIFTCASLLNMKTLVDIVLKKKKFAMLIGFIFFLCFFVSLIPWITNTYGNNGAWCWLSIQQYKKPHNYGICALLFLYGHIFLCFLLFIISALLNAYVLFNVDINKMKRTMGYLCGLFVCMVLPWAPGFGRRGYEWYHSAEAPIKYKYLHSLGTGSIGIWLLMYVALQYSGRDVGERVQLSQNEESISITDFSNSQIDSQKQNALMLTTL
eukprot:329028_1